MRIGIVSYWFNRGQGVVGRHIRSALDALGHDTFVLARPTKTTFSKPAFVSRDDVWAQDGVSEGANFDLDVDEYVSWARHHELDVAFCFQNLQFAEVTALRESGVRTIGSFVWEAFGPEHVGPAVEAYDEIYSLTLAEQERYSTFGIESPYVQWGIHPEVMGTPSPPRRRRRGRDAVRFYYPGGYLTPRKPTAEVLEAFAAVRDRRARLVLKAQNEKAGRRLKRASGGLSRRVEVHIGDLDQREHHALFGGCDVSLAPSRWEGLGLHLFEAVALGLPTITSDGPPMNEMVKHGRDGLLIESAHTRDISPGVPVLEPDVASITRCIEEMMDDGLRAELAEGVAERRAERSWDRTVHDYEELLRMAVEQ